MTSLVWKEGSVASLRLRDGSFALLQLLKSPYLVFFDVFSSPNVWPADAVEKAGILFTCAVARVFTKFSPLERKPQLRGVSFSPSALPSAWIRPFPGSRRITIFSGTAREQQVTLVSGSPGGQLVEMHLDASGPQTYPVLRSSIPLDDDKTIDGHEMDGIWPYPGLNERVLISKQVGRSVDPEKDMVFDRPMREEYATYFNLRNKRGKPEDWGYSTQPYQRAKK